MVKSPTEETCATSPSISAGFCSFVTVQEHNTVLTSTLLWIKTKRLTPGMEDIWKTLGQFCLYACPGFTGEVISCFSERLLAQ